MQGLVTGGDIPAIKSHVREMIEIFSQNSGYVFNQVHNIQANVPPEIVLAIYETALSYRKEQQKG